MPVLSSAFASECVPSNRVVARLNLKGNIEQHMANAHWYTMDFVHPEALEEGYCMVVDASHRDGISSKGGRRESSNAPVDSAQRAPGQTNPSGTWL